MVTVYQQTKMADEKEIQAPLSKFEQLCLIISLEETIVKLNLMRHVINQKCSVEDVQEKLQTKLYVRNREKLQNLAKFEHQLKLENKRKEIIAVLRAVVAEMKENKSFTFLKNYVEIEESQHHEIESFFLKENNLKENLNFLKKELSLLLETTQHEIHEKDEEIINLKTKIQTVKREFKTTEPKLLEENQETLNVLKNKGLTNYKELQRHFESLRGSLDEEKLSHEEVKAHLEKCDLQLQEKAKYWMEKLQKDTEDITREITETKETLRQIKLRKTQLSEKCDKLEKALEVENEIKELKRQKQLELQKEASVILIQRWWRQILAVRHAKTCKKKQKQKKGKP